MSNMENMTLGIHSILYLGQNPLVFTSKCGMNPGIFHFLHTYQLAVFANFEPNHYWNQCWFVVNGNDRWHFNKNTIIVVYIWKCPPFCSGFNVSTMTKSNMLFTTSSVFFSFFLPASTPPRSGALFKSTAPKPGFPLLRSVPEQDQESFWKLKRCYLPIVLVIILLATWQHDLDDIVLPADMSLPEWMLIIITDPLQPQ